MEVFFTKRAIKNYKSIKEYNSGRFGALVAEAFENKLIDFFGTFKKLSGIGKFGSDGKRYLGISVQQTNTHILPNKKE